MTAPEQQADLRQRIAEAEEQRAAVRAELGTAGERIAAVAFDLATGSRVVAPDEVYAAIAAHRSEVLALVQPELAALREQRDLLQSGQVERQALLEEARDALETAGQAGPHGDDWPAIAPAIRALAADRDRYAASLAAALPSTDDRLRSNAAANHTIATNLRAKVDAVLALHRPVPRGAMTICDACSPRRGDGPTRYVLVDYPCPTATALNSVPLPTT